ncbi:secreted protein [Halorubrum coriense DSM 10284]|uniref:Secreted protein n=1 Tax=Halorubrum coriense DSM 10284 TaxID=1227466 RepID=M0EAT6_9EURY|nr:spondin domain-containing protein [Halorubrum coriense]ELZ44158.1 secreted protein [Halorubrum coriense DSM 10284]
MTHRDTRRRFLAASGGLVTLALAGCLSDGGSDGQTGDEDGMDGDDEMGGNDSMSGDDGTDGDDGMDEDNETDDDGMAESATVRVRIENVAPADFYSSDGPTNGAIWITPGAYAVHGGQNPIYELGEPASIGLEALAEAGPPTGFEGEDGLVDELEATSGVDHSGAYTPADTVADPNDPTGEVPGAPPIAPGGAFEFEVDVSPGHRLSFASMFVPSNDAFVSTDEAGIELWPEGGDPVDGDVTDAVMLFDAGTEPNAEPPGAGPDQAPAQDAPDQGPGEDGVVRRLGEVDDGHEYPAVGDVVQVTVTPT